MLYQVSITYPDKSKREYQLRSRIKPINSDKLCDQVYKEQPLDCVPIAVKVSPIYL
jgi:hypothetical protein